MVNVLRLLVAVGVLSILMVNVQAVDNASVITLPPTLDEETTYIKGNIFTQVKVSDNSQRITKLEISVMPNNTCAYCQSAVLVNLSDNFTYSVIKQYDFPHQNVRHFLFYQNYTIFNINETQLGLLGSITTIADFTTYVRYLESGNTTFSVSTGGFIVDDWIERAKYTTANYVGMPATSVTVNSLSTFNMEVTWKNIPNEIELQREIASLSGISRFLYGVLTLHFTVFGYQVEILEDSPTLLHMLALFDVFLLLIEVTFKVLFVYPYLVMIWLLIILPNFYTAFAATTMRELAFGYVTYYKAIGRVSYNVGMYVVQKIIDFISMLLNFISNVIPL